MPKAAALPVMGAAIGALIVMGMMAKADAPPGSEMGLIMPLRPTPAAGGLVPTNTLVATPAGRTLPARGCTNPTFGITGAEGSESQGSSELLSGPMGSGMVLTSFQ